MKLKVDTECGLENPLEVIPESIAANQTGIQRDPRATEGQWSRDGATSATVELTFIGELEANEEP